jgi:hypothetical protein
LLRAIAHAEQHGRRAAAALAPTIENLAMLGRQLEMGCSVESILEFMAVTGGTEKRRAADEAIRNYHDAVTELRGLLMQALVAESGSRSGDVAREASGLPGAVAHLSETDESIRRRPEVWNEER